MTQVQPDQVQSGTDVGDIPHLIDVGGGLPGFPVIDGSKLTGVIATGVTSPIKDLVSIKKPSCPALLFTRCGAVMFLRNECG